MFSLHVHYKMRFPAKLPVTQFALKRFQFEVDGRDVPFQMAGEKLFAVGTGGVGVTNLADTWGCMEGYFLLG